MNTLTIKTNTTPNPNALTFTLNLTVKTQGNSNYKSPLECGENQLAVSLFTIKGVDQVHFFDNTITITKFGYEDWDQVTPIILKVLKEKAKNHSPNYHDFDPEAERRESLSKDLVRIEEIFDQTIRSALQGDGGDIQTVSLEDNILIVRYQGACGTCPSSATGTLEAIKGILREKFHPDIDVFIEPQW